jgi:hypothetical protein
MKTNELIKAAMMSSCAVKSYKAVDPTAKEQFGDKSAIDFAATVFSNVITVANNVGEFVSEWKDIPFDEIYIPEAFTEFLLPTSVRFVEGNQLYPDLRIRENIGDIEIDKADIAKAMEVLASSRKKSDASKVALAAVEQRKAVSLAAVTDRISINGKCLVTLDRGIFIPVTPSILNIIPSISYANDADEAEMVYALDDIVSKIKASVK